LLNFQKFIAVRNSKRSRCGVLLALLLCAGPLLPVHAVEVPTLFTAEAPLDGESDNPRDEAYKVALVEVLTRISGSQLSSDEAAIDELFPVPSAYVTQYRPGAEGTLWVSFDGEAIERVLRAAGQTVWASDRPLTLVWLAVDWGQGEREIIAAGEADRAEQQTRSIDRNRLLRERVLEIAAKRGLPLVFPLLDTQDLRSVTFSDLWGGFDERVLAASKRYGARSILIGRVRPSSAQPNRWTYVFGDESLRWTGPPEAIIGQIADTLAADFAVGGDAPLERVALNISGIQTVDDYGSVQKLLAAVSVIEGFRIAKVVGDRVDYQVQVRGGADRLRRALRFAGLLEQLDSDDFAGPDPVLALEFFYSP